MSVDTESSIDLKLRRDPHYANAHSKKCLITRPPMQRKPCWNDNDKTDMIDTCARGWVCPPVYMIPRLDAIETCPEGEDHVFDGAHKLEAVFEFMDGGFALKYKDLTTAYLAEYNGKKFAQLPRDLQERIRKYKFHINIVDEATATDPDVLRVLWERVNRAGKRLNEYEINIPITVPLIEHVITPCMGEFFKTPLFPKEISNRGELEQRMITLLALAEYGALPKRKGEIRNSLPSVVLVWQKNYMGATMPERELNVEKYRVEWCDTLRRAIKIMRDFEQLNMFCISDDDATSIMEEAQRTDLLFILARTVRFFPKIEDFRSQKKNLAAMFKKEIIHRSSMDLVGILGAKGRNWAFQRKLVCVIDDILQDSVDALQPRLFTREQKEAKLIEQGGKCAACKKKVLPHQLNDGDHIVEWCQGGETSMENLQILHRLCHQNKE